MPGVKAQYSGLFCLDELPQPENTGRIRAFHSSLGKLLPYLFYTLLIWLLLPFSLLRLLWKSRQSPEYRHRWRERLAWYPRLEPPAARPRVIFHAVSVGEVHAVQPLIDAFMAAHPDYAVMITTSTPTGSERVHALFGERVEHVYLPWDLESAVMRFLQRFKPELLVLLETELWPNLVRGCQRSGCKVVLANARLSSKSLKAYKRFGELMASTLQGLQWIAAQSAGDARNFLLLGMPDERLCITGSLKFDVVLSSGQLERACELRHSWPQRPVWIAASTREGEDAKVLEACRLVLAGLPDALLILVPRHPERFTAADHQARAGGLQVQRFSSAEPLADDTRVLLGDTMGDMALYYGLADVAFVGGSLVPTGCQNLIEPASLGLPVLAGPSLFNFRRVSELLQEAGGMHVVADVPGLAKAVVRLLQDSELREQMGTAARQEVLRNQGAAQRQLALLEDCLGQSSSQAG